MTGAKSAAAIEVVAAVRGKQCAGEGKSQKMPAKAADAAFFAVHGYYLRLGNPAG
jgi:hypothetical protein